jgi:hypothetical protein
MALHKNSTYVEHYGTRHLFHNVFGGVLLHAVEIWPFTETLSSEIELADVE